MKTIIHIKIMIKTVLLAVAVQANGLQHDYPLLLLDSLPLEQPWKSGETTVTLSDGGTRKASEVGVMGNYDYYATIIIQV